MNKIYYLPERTEIKNLFTMVDSAWSQGMKAGFEDGVDAVYSAAKEITPEKWNKLAKAIAEFVYHEKYGYDTNWGHTGTVDDSGWRIVESRYLRTSQQLISDFIAEKEAKDANL